MLDGLWNAIRRSNARRRLENGGLIGGRRNQEEENANIVAIERSPVLCGFMLVMVWMVSTCLLTLCVREQPVGESLVLNQRAAQTLNAAIDFRYTDLAATEIARENAASAEPHCYVISSRETGRILDAFQLFFAASARDPEVEKRDQKHPLPVQLALELSPGEREVIRKCHASSAQFHYVESALAEVLSGGILSGDSRKKMAEDQKLRISDEQQRARLPRQISEIADPESAAGAVADGILKFFPPDAERLLLFRRFSGIAVQLIGKGNLIYDESATLEAMAQARGKIPLIVREIPRNRPLLRKGEVVTAQKLEMIESYNTALREHIDQSRRWQLPFRNAFWSLVLVAVAGFYLYNVHPEIVRSNRNTALMSLVVLIALFANFSGVGIFRALAGHYSLPLALTVNALPLALVGILLAPVLGYRVAVCAGFFIASVAALMLEMSFEFALRGMLIVSLAALAVRSATNYRSYVMRAFFSIFPSVWILNSYSAYTVTGTFAEQTEVFLKSGAVSLVNALITALLALVCIFIFELLLHIATNMSLMVLCDYNHPLLERMKREAPGSFFHSLMVATLAEDAARAIGANALRTKAGALFHDIGKLSNPQYFTENNQTGGNLHTDLTPQMSSIIIRDHVKEGLILARQYQLGRAVTEAIAEHHGNDLVHYFYRQAVENSRRTGDAVQQSQFRYDGTPPVSRETSIVSLADACEAACRSVEKSSAAKIEAIVNDIFAMRFRERQLINSQLTLAELEKIKSTFVSTLMSMKHGRIAYPKDETEDEDDILVAPGEAPAPAASQPEAAQKTDLQNR